MKKQKAILLFVGLGLIILVGFLLKPTYFYLLREKANPNSINLVNHSSLDINDFIIKWSKGNKNQKPIYEHGKDLNVRFKEYGDNFFYVYFKEDSLIGQFHQFKYNNWHGHDYTFEIGESKEGINVEWSVKGPDEERTYKITNYNKSS